MSDAVPAQARVVVIGGGIAGCSVAYHLAKLGWRDVVLLERRELSCGTTWHAAGLVGQLRATHNLTRLAKYGADLYERLEAETGQATGFRRPGSLSLARNSRAHARAGAPGVDGALLRRRRRGDHAGRGGTPLAAPAHRRPGRRGVAAARRAHESHRHHAGPRQGRAPGRRHDPREHRGDGDPHPRRRRRGRRHLARRHRLRGRGQLRGHVGARSRRAWPAWRCRCTPPSTSTS